MSGGPPPTAGSERSSSGSHAQRSQLHAQWSAEQQPRRGTWCSITSAPHVEGPGFNPQCVHIAVLARAPVHECAREWLAVLRRLTLHARARAALMRCNGKRAPAPPSVPKTASRACERTPDGAANRHAVQQCAMNKQSSRASPRRMRMRQRARGWHAKANRCCRACEPRPRADLNRDRWIQSPEC